MSIVKCQMSDLFKLLIIRKLVKIIVKRKVEKSMDKSKELAQKLREEFEKCRGMKHTP